MMYSSGSKNFQHKKLGSCERNLQNIYVALKTYSLDFNNYFPSFAGATNSETPLSMLVPRYTTGTEYFVCPGSKDKPLPEAQPFSGGKISYAYYMGVKRNAGADVPLVSDAQVNTNSKRRGDPVFSSDGKGAGANHRKFGGSILFADGHVETWGASAARELRVPPGAVLLNPKP